MKVDFELERVIMAPENAQDIAYLKYVLGLQEGGTSCSAVRIVPLIVGDEAHAQNILTPVQAFGVLQIKRNFLEGVSDGRSMTPVSRPYGTPSSYSVLPSPRPDPEIVDSSREPGRER